MRNAFAAIFAAIGIGGAAAMFTVKTSQTVGGGGAFGSGVHHVHPAWATAVGILVLLLGLGLAAACLFTRSARSAA